MTSAATTKSKLTILHRQWVVEIGLNPADVGGQHTGARKQIGAGDGSIATGVLQAQRQLPGAGTEIQHVARSVEADERALDRRVDRLVARAAAVFGRSGAPGA